RGSCPPAGTDHPCAARRGAAPRLGVSSRAQAAGDSRTSRLRQPGSLGEAGGSGGDDGLRYLDGAADPGGDRLLRSEQAVGSWMKRAVLALVAFVLVAGFAWVRGCSGPRPQLVSARMRGTVAEAVIRNAGCGEGAIQVDFR